MLDLINLFSPIHFYQSCIRFWLSWIAWDWRVSWVKNFSVKISTLLSSHSSSSGHKASVRTATFSIQWTRQKQDHVNISFLWILESRSRQNSPRVGVYLHFLQSKIILLKINTINQFSWPAIILFTGIQTCEDMTVYPLPTLWNKA